MSLVKVAVYGTVGKAVNIDTSLPSRVRALEEALANLQLTGGPVQQHKNLGGLQVGDDHPQYTMWAAPERITGQWQFTKPIWASDGTALLPGYTWTLDPNTGFYRITDDSIGATTAGVQRWSVDTTRVNQTLPLRIQSNSGFLLQNEGAGGFAGIEMLSFNGFDPAQECGNRLAFWESPARLHGFRIEHEGDIDVTGDLDFYRHNNSASGNLFLRFTRDSNQVQFADGTENAPVITNIGDEDTGMSFPAVNEMAWSAGGTARMRLNASLWRISVQGQFTDGSAGTPSISFTSATTSGFYFISTSRIGASAGGTLRWDWNTTRILSTIPFQGADGSNTAPTYSFGSDSANGMYLSASDTLGWTTNGVLRESLSTTALRLVTDSYELQIGAGAAGVGDLRLYHDGTNSIIRNDTGSLKLQQGTVIGISVGAGGANDVDIYPGSSTCGVNVDATNTNTCDFRMRQGGVNRWIFRKTGTSETGSNAGSDFAIVARADDGTSLGNALTATRATGALGLGFGASSHVTMVFDNQELKIGAGADLRLFHDGTNSIIRNDTGALHLQFSTNVRFSVNTTGVSFNGQTPIARPDYTITNPTTNRSIDVTAITLAQLAQVVGTMIQDNIDYGLYQ